MNEGLKALYAGIGAISAGIVGIIWGGYVFSVLWAWFIVAVFAAPALTVAQAISMTLLLRFTTAKRRTDAGQEPTPGRDLADSFFVPLVFLGAGWIVKQWLPS